MKLKMRVKLDLGLMLQDEDMPELKFDYYLDMEKWETLHCSSNDAPYLVFDIARLKPEEEHLLEKQRNISTLQHYMEEQLGKEEFLKGD